MTYEFTFPGGSAVITTTTGGTIDQPDFCVSGETEDRGFDGDACSVFAAELLRRCGKNEPLGGSPDDDPILGDGGYPSDTELQRIREWPWSDLHGLFDYIAERWKYPEYWCSIFDQGVSRISCSTGGWSGNESLIQALGENLMAWVMTWQESVRGGHYKFQVRNDS